MRFPSASRHDHRVSVGWPIHWSATAPYIWATVLTAPVAIIAGLMGPTVVLGTTVLVVALFAVMLLPRISLFVAIAAIPVSLPQLTFAVGGRSALLPVSDVVLAALGFGYVLR